MMLTDKKCKGAKPTQKVQRLFDGGGLFLEVSIKGSKYWRLKYRFNGKEKRLALGVYPSVSLREARDLRDQYKKDVRQGVDPSQQRKIRKLQQITDSESTFELVTREWHEIRKSEWSTKHAHDVITRLERNVLPAIGNLPINEVDAQIILNVLKAVNDRSPGFLPKKLKHDCNGIFRYANETGRIKILPSLAFKEALPAPKKGNWKALEIDELPDFLKALERNEPRLFLPTRYATELLLLTMVRTSELIEAKWNEFNFKDAMWTIPGQRMKMGNEHLVPLSKQSLEILNRLKSFSHNSDYVFPHRFNLSKPMSNATVLGAIKRLGFKDKTTGHGFRSLALSTIKEKLGYRHEVPDRQLAHVPQSEVDRAYDRAKFLPDRIIMMQEWADYLDSLK